MFYKGVHVDNTTAYKFELYTYDDTMDDAAAFNAYLAAYEHNNAPAETLEERDWYDCQFPRQGHGIERFCCNTAHSIGAAITDTGSTTVGGFLAQLLKNAFDGTRDGQAPRSICHVFDEVNVVCTSWATYSGRKITDKQRNDIVQYSIDCGRSGGSAEFKTVIPDGGVLYKCVSDRARGCGIPKDGPT